MYEGGSCWGMRVVVAGGTRGRVCFHLVCHHTIIRLMIALTSCDINLINTNQLNILLI